MSSTVSLRLSKPKLSPAVEADGSAPEQNPAATGAGTSLLWPRASTLVSTSTSAAAMALGFSVGGSHHGQPTPTSYACSCLEQTAFITPPGPRPGAEVVHFSGYEARWQLLPSKIRFPKPSHDA